MSEKQIYKYPNGATLIYYHQNLNKTTSATIGFKVPLVTVPTADEQILRYKNVIFYQNSKTGAIRVPFIKPGEIHFAEHMFFKNLPNMDKTEIYNEFTRTNTQYNAFTTQNSVSMDFDCISKHADRIFELESRMLLRNNFDVSELNKEKLIIIQELREVLINCRGFNPIKYLQSDENLSGPEILGMYAEIIDSITPNELKRFCRTHFTTQNLVMSVVSDLSFEEVKELCDKHFVSKLPNIPESKVTVVPTSYEFLKDLYITAYSKESTTCNINFIFRGTTDAATNDKISYFENYLMNGLGGKLCNKLRLETPLTYTPSFNSINLPKLNLKSYEFQTSPENVNACIYYFTELINGIIENGITQEEFEGFKEMWENRRDRKGNIKYKSANEMFFRYIEGLDLFIPDMYEKVANLTIEEINEYFKNQFTKSPLLLCISGNFDQAELPSMEDIVTSFRPFEKYVSQKLTDKRKDKQLFDILTLIMEQKLSAKDVGISLVAPSKVEQAELEKKKQEEQASQSNDNQGKKESEQTKSQETPNASEEQLLVPTV